MSRQGEIVGTYTARGISRYQMEIWHDELNKYQLIKGNTQSEVYEKAMSKSNQWDEMWEKYLHRENQKENIQNKKENAIYRTSEAINAHKELNEILLNRKIIKFNSLKMRRHFKNKPPIVESYFSYPDQPIYPRQPQKNDRKYYPKIGFFDELFSSWKKQKFEKTEKQFKQYITSWNNEVEAINNRYQTEVNRIRDENGKIENGNDTIKKEYVKNKQLFLYDVDEYNNNLLSIKEKCEQGDVESLENIFSMILDKSEYPEYIDVNFEVEYNNNNKILIVDYQLPAPENIPKLKDVKYIQSRDEYTEKELSNAEFNNLYDNILYQIPLRVTYELYNSDMSDYIESIIINGFVNSIDPSTGIQNNSCILSLQTQMEEFQTINLDSVDSKSCFKRFKGVGSSKLHLITPIKPILEISKEDKRFISGYEVADTLQEGYNIAAMDWQDFENLIRELFAKEFSKDGGEVKVTQSSRDGGVDAVAFDNDPIRGGKIVIQAKRYTNTVGVSAVRDLYGTVMNEGAMKGILITTADYGPDAYAFAKDKPLTLLNGGHLLHMLKDYGHSVKIDLKEAKEILSEYESN